MSTVPVVHDIGDLDVDAAPFKRGKAKKALVAVLGLAAVVGGAAFALKRLDQLPTAAAELPKAQAAQVAAPAYTPPPPAVTPPAVTPPPAPTPEPAATPPSDEKAESASSARLSSDVKEALLKNDKSKKQSKKAAKAGRRSSVARSSGPSTGFKSGGNANDPLNAKL
jgi:hypothetical protein